MKPILRVRQEASWASFMRETHCPPIQTSPRSGLSRPAMRLSSVVLPEPDGPMMPRNSPSATSRLRLRKTVISSPPRAKDLTTFRTCMIGSAAIRASEITTDEHSVYLCSSAVNLFRLAVQKRHDRSHFRTQIFALFILGQRLPFRIDGRELDLHAHRHRRLAAIPHRH